MGFYCIELYYFVSYFITSDCFLLFYIGLFCILLYCIAFYCILLYWIVLYEKSQSNSVGVSISGFHSKIFVYFEHLNL